MAPHFLISLAALVLLGFALDRIAASAWTAAHKKLSLIFRLSLMAAGYLIVYFTNSASTASTASQHYESFFLWLFGLAMGFRLAEKIKVWRTKRADARELTESIDEALIAHKSGVAASTAVEIDGLNHALRFDVTRYETELVYKRVNALIKSGYRVTTITEHSNDKVILLVGLPAPPSN